MIAVPRDIMIKITTKKRKGVNKNRNYESLCTSQLEMGNVHNKIVLRYFVIYTCNFKTKI